MPFRSYSSPITLDMEKASADDVESLKALTIAESGSSPVKTRGNSCRQVKPNLISNCSCRWEPALQQTLRIRSKAVRVAVQPPRLLRIIRVCGSQSAHVVQQVHKHWQVAAAQCAPDNKCSLCCCTASPRQQPAPTFGAGKEHSRSGLQGRLSTRCRSVCATRSPAAP